MGLPKSIKYLLLPTNIEKKYYWHSSLYSVSTLSHIYICIQIEYILGKRSSILTSLKNFRKITSGGSSSSSREREREKEKGSISQPTSPESYTISLDDDGEDECEYFSSLEYVFRIYIYWLKRLMFLFHAHCLCLFFSFTGYPSLFTLFHSHTL